MWFKVDDNFWSHPKTLTLSDEAISAWVKAGSYCGQHLTDGFVPASARTLLGIRKESAINELVESGLWREVDGGWQFHDWEEYQPSRESVEDRRVKDRKRKAEARAAYQRKRETARQSPQSVRAESAQTPDGIRKESALPDPTRPDPTINRESAASQAQGRKRPARPLPDDWQPRDQERRAATAKGIDPDALADDMRNWAQAKDERRVDWDATFRTFISRERPSRNADPLNRWQQAFNSLAADEYPDHHMIEGAS